MDYDESNVALETVSALETSNFLSTTSYKSGAKLPHLNNGTSIAAISGLAQFGNDTDFLRKPMKGRFDPNQTTNGKRTYKLLNTVSNSTYLELVKCKKRYQQISITNLGNLTSATSRLRILQSSTEEPEEGTATTEVTISSEEAQWSDTSSAVWSLMSIGLTLVALTLSYL